NTSTNYYDPNTLNQLGTADALGDTTTNYYDPNGLLLESVDAVGAVTTNSYDNSENLIATAVLSPGGGTILSSNTFAYDANGNRTTSTVWRVASSGGWVPAVTTYIYDSQNRVIETIDPDDGTNTVIYTPAGQQ